MTGTSKRRRLEEEEEAEGGRQKRGGEWASSFGDGGGRRRKRNRRGPSAAAIPSPAVLLLHLRDTRLGSVGTKGGRRGTGFAISRRRRRLVPRRRRRRRRSGEAMRRHPHMPVVLSVPLSERRVLQGLEPGGRDLICWYW